MLEAAVTTLLNKYLGDFIEGVNKEQLDLGLWKGDVTLRNVKVRREALKRLNLPIEVHRGYIGSLVLKIPWKNLKTEPVHVLADHLYVVAVPRSQMRYDPEYEEERRQRNKERRWEEFEDERKNAKDRKSGGDSGDDVFARKLITKIVANLQLNVGYVHIRYEDSSSDPSHPFAMGLTLHRLSMQSTNADWTPGFVRKPGDFIHKIIGVESLSVYFDRHPDFVAHLGEAEFARAMLAGIPDQDGRCKVTHQYVVKPASIDCKVRLHSGSQILKAVPKVQLDIIMEALQIELDRRQYCDLIMLSGALQRLILAEPYRQYRPTVSVSKDKRAWWRFAITCVRSRIQDRNRRWSWSFFKARRDERQRYIVLYNKRLKDKASTTKVELAMLEKQLSFEDMRLYRLLAEAERKRLKRLKKEPAPAAAGSTRSTASVASVPGATPIEAPKKKQSGFLAKLRRKKTAATGAGAAAGASVQDVSGRDSVLLELDESDLSALFSVIDMKEDDEAEQRFPDDYTWLSIGAALNTLSVSLLSADTPVLFFGLKGMRVDVKNRPVASQVEASLRSLSLTGADGVFLAPKADGVTKSADPVLFHLTFDSAPASRHADMLLEAELAPLEVTYSKRSVDHLIAFLTPPDDESSLALFQRMLGQTLQKVREQTRLQLERHLRLHKTMELHVNLRAPVIVVPSPCNTAFLVVDLGQVIIGSDVVEREKKRELLARQKHRLSPDELEELQRVVYDRLSLKLLALQVVVGPALPALRSALGDERGTPYHILRPTDANLFLDQCFAPDALELPQLCCTGEILRFGINVTTDAFKQLMIVIDGALSSFFVPDDVLDLDAEEETALQDDIITHHAYAAVIGDTDDFDNLLALELDADSRDEGLARSRSSLRTPSRSSSHASLASFGQSAAPSSEASSRAWWRRVTVLLYLHIHDATVALGDSAALTASSMRIQLLDRFYETAFALSVQQLQVTAGGAPMLRSGQSGRKHQQSRTGPQIVVQRDVPLVDMLRANARHGPNSAMLLLVKDIKPSNPELRSIHRGTLNSVSLRLAPLDIQVDPLTLNPLMTMILETFLENPLPSLVDAHPRTLFTDNVIMNLRAMRAADLVNFGFEASIGGISVSMSHTKDADGAARASDEAGTIATLSVASCSVGVSEYRDRLEVEAHVGSIQLVAHSAQGSDDMISSDVDKDGALCTVSMTTYQRSASSYPGHDGKLQVRLGSLQVVYISDAVVALIDAGLAVGQSVAPYLAPSPAPAQRNLMDVGSSIQATKMLFDVELHAPRIILPDDRMRQNRLVIDLGLLTFANRFVESTARTTTDAMSLALEGVQMNTELGGASVSLMERFDIHIALDRQLAAGGVTQALQATPTRVRSASGPIRMHGQSFTSTASASPPRAAYFAPLSPEINVSVKLGLISFSVTDAQYAFLLARLVQVAQNIGALLPLLQQPSQQSVVVPRPRGESVGSDSRHAFRAVQEAKQLVPVFGIDVELAGGKLLLVTTTASGGAHLLIDLSVKEAVLTVRGLATGAIDVSFRSSGLALRDCRPFSVWDPARSQQNVIFREVLQFGSADDGSDRRLTVGVKVLPSGSVALDVSVPPLSVVASTDLALSLYDFIYPPLAEAIELLLPLLVGLVPPAAATPVVRHAPPSASMPVARRGRLSSDVGRLSPASASPLAAPVAELKQVTANVQMDEMRVAYAHDITQYDSEAIVVSVQSVFVAVAARQSTAVTVGVGGITAFVCRMNAQNKRVVILDPFRLDCSLTLANAQVAARPVSEVRSPSAQVLRIDPISVRVSYSDIRVAHSMATDALAMVSAYQHRQATEQQRAPLTALVHGDVFATFVAAPMRARRAAAVADEIMSQFRGEVMHVQFGGVSATVINDCGSSNLPLLEAQLRAMDIDLSDWSIESLSAKTQLTFSADFFNSKLSAWEPVVEPCTLYVHLSGKGADDKQQKKEEQEDTSAGRRISLVASIPTSLDVTVSHTMLRTLLEVAEDWKSDLALSAAAKRDKMAAASKNQRADYHPYVLKNATGGDLDLWTSEVADVTREARQAQFSGVLRDGETLEWNPGTWMRAVDKAAAVPPPRMSVRFAESLGVRPVSGIPVDRVGLHLMRLEPVVGEQQPASAPLYLVCEVRFSRGVKTVLFRSSAALHNGLSCPLKVRIRNEDASSAGPAVIVAPGATWSVPMAITKVGACYLQLAPDGGEFAYSTHQLNAEVLRQDASSAAICKPVQQQQTQQQAQQAPFYVQLDTQVVWQHHDAASISRGFPANLLIRASPPIRIDNAVPADIIVSIVDADLGVVIESDTVLEGASSCFFHADVSRRLMLSIQVPSLRLVCAKMARITLAGQSLAMLGGAVELVSDSETTPAAARQTVRLNLHNAVLPGHRSSRVIGVYAPIVLVNKTALPLQFRQAGGLSSGPSATTSASASTLLSVASEDDAAGSASTNEVLAQTAVQLFSFRSSSVAPRLAVRVSGQTQYSAGFGIAAGSTGEAQLKGVSGAGGVQLGVAMRLGSGRFFCSKVITFSPRFVIANRTGYALEVRAADSETAAALLVDNDARLPFHFDAKSRLVRVRLHRVFAGGDGGAWSVPFGVNDVGDVFVRTPDPDTTGGSRSVLLRARIALEGATLFVLLTVWARGAPFRVDNLSETGVRFGQTAADALPGASRYLAQPRQCVPFALDLPSAADRSITIHVGKHSRRVDLARLGDHKPFAFPHGGLALAVVPDNGVRVLQLRRLVGARSEIISDDDDDDATVDEQVDDGPSFHVSLNVAEIGVSLVSAAPRELVYLNLQGLAASLQLRAAQQSVEVSLQELQVDNQMPNFEFPVLLARAPPRTEQAKRSFGAPIIQMSAILAATMAASASAPDATSARRSGAGSVLVVRYCSLLVQQLSVEVEESTIRELIRFATGLAPSSASAARQLERSPLFAPGALDASGVPPVPRRMFKGERSSVAVYLEVFQIQPIGVNVSLVRSLSASSDSAPDDDYLMSATTRPVRVLVEALTMSLGNVRDAPVRLNALELSLATLDASTLKALIGRHYAQQALTQVHKVVGAVDLIGNPVGLFSNLASGVEDFFYEPYLGLVRSPEDFARGLGRGTASLLRNSVAGLFGGVSKITSSVSKGLAEATFDRQYKAERHEAQRERPAGTMAGVAAGATTVLKGFGAGLAGLFQKPAQGARESGALGFVKGIGTGIAGVVTKPVIGVLDGTSKIAQGITSSSLGLDAHFFPARKRLPRFIQSDGLIKPFEKASAVGSDILRRAGRRAFEEDLFVAMLALSTANCKPMQEAAERAAAAKTRLNGDDYTTYLLLTTTNLIACNAASLEITWHIPLDDVDTLRVQPGVLAVVRGGAQKEIRSIECSDNAAKNRFADELQREVLERQQARVFASLPED